MVASYTSGGKSTDAISRCQSEMGTSYFEFSRLNNGANSVAFLFVEETGMPGESELSQEALDSRKKKLF